MAGLWGCRKVRKNLDGTAVRAVHARGPVRHLGRGELARLLHPQPTIQVRAGREKGQSPARLRDAQAALVELPEYPLALLLRVHRTPSWTALGPRFCPRSLRTSSYCTSTHGAEDHREVLSYEGPGARPGRRKRRLTLAEPAGMRWWNR